MTDVKLEDRPAVYVLASASGAHFFEGSARSLRTRVETHMAGMVTKTKNSRPLRLVYFEYCESYMEAKRRESWLKSEQGRHFLTQYLDPKASDRRKRQNRPSAQQRLREMAPRRRGRHVGLPATAEKPVVRRVNWR